MLGAFGVLAVSLVSVAWRWSGAPRAWKPEEVPVAFWAWRAETPTDEEVARAATETRARALFLRAGQFDSQKGAVVRVRPVAGRMPRALELHFVYAATPALLAEFERVEEGALAVAVAETFARDAERAEGDGARVAGLQLDFDVPTRLLRRYASVLREVRARLPRDRQLSVTGLQTWMTAAADLREVLDAVDFWAPQFYGAEVPVRLETAKPISSPRAVGRAAARARSFGKPFYAGLSAYGYALLYTRGGALAELRGDLDPAHVALSQDFELVERRAFDASGGVAGAAGGAKEGGGRAASASEWRYVYRATTETVVDGLTVREGESVVFDLPSGESLRESVRGVREQAGGKLLGILIFRLPARGEPGVLTLAQIAAALSDTPARVSTEVRLEGGARRARAGGLDANQLPTGGGGRVSNHLLLTATNDGAAGALLGEGALVVTLRVPRGGVRGVAGLEGFDSFETLCGASARPCGAARADLVRLKASAWPCGASARARLSFEGELPGAFLANVAVRADDGRDWTRSQTITLAEGEGVDENRAGKN